MSSIAARERHRQALRAGPQALAWRAESPAGALLRLMPRKGLTYGNFTPNSADAALDPAAQLNRACLCRTLDLSESAAETLRRGIPRTVAVNTAHAGTL